MQKWEYMVIANYWKEETQKLVWTDDETDERGAKSRLNAHGQEGWEVVSALSSGPRNLVMTIILKRPIE
jgi:hypothetical protein